MPFSGKKVQYLFCFIAATWYICVYVCMHIYLVCVLVLTTYLLSILPEHVLILEMPVKER